MKFAVIFVLQIFIVCVSSSQLLSSFLIFSPWLITLTLADLLFESLGLEADAGGVEDVCRMM